ncbi:hypothetical protein [Streptomyces sp. NL15-2K]|uniref:hypothetical protein n=1 Tax=Streptomyces sp. NL15-2K TaxID=376149 RepID=UPI000F57FB45|nr:MULTISPECIES: hypothetical protein [Actinomycetes]WKX12707.1 hypothetical protein Q4V64_36380 [Kutzneria buriramensis]GCB43079.1 hypothetical protein SNL152K_363 [Streptomyces sp. NL15-2K]
MSADEFRGDSPAGPARARTGPRHAAPKKPLFTRFHVPAGKAIAMAAMPTAVLMGMGFTPTLAIADEQPTSNSLKADEYKDCLAALEDGPSKSPTPSPSASTDESKDKSPDSSSDASDKGDAAEPKPSAPTGSSGDSSSSDSGSDDKDDAAAKPEPTPSPSTSPGKEGTSGDAAAKPSPSPSETGGGNLLEDIGDAITGIFTGGKDTSETASPTPSTTPSPSASDDAAKDSSDAVKETTEKVTGTVDDTVKDTTDKASKAAEDTTKAAEKAAEDAAEKATASPSPSPSSSTDPEKCPAATDAEGGVDNKTLVPDDPWYLEASSLTLKGADYQGIVEVRTASGKTKKVLKYVISDGTDIGDLHQLVKEHGKTYHVQAAKGSTSKITNGKTVMYTESISGNLLGLVPLTFDPEHPPPINLPWIYFTNVKVVQAAQFGGTLNIPGMRQYVTE